MHRFAELSWFWDPRQQWLLPFRCTNCKSVISAEFISTSVVQRTSCVHLVCPHCYCDIRHTLKYASGDPRNIALIGHWDGWQPFSTSLRHSCGMKLLFKFFNYYAQLDRVF